MAEAEDKPKSRRGRPPIPDKEECVSIRLVLKASAFDKVEHWAALCGLSKSQLINKLFARAEIELILSDMLKEQIDMFASSDEFLFAAQKQNVALVSRQDGSRKAHLKRRLSKLQAKQELEFDDDITAEDNS